MQNNISQFNLRITSVNHRNLLPQDLDGVDYVAIPRVRLGDYAKQRKNLSLAVPALSVLLMAIGAEYCISRALAGQHEHPSFYTGFGIIAAGAAMLIASCIASILEEDVFLDLTREI